MAGQGPKALRRMDTAGMPDDFLLPKSRYGVGVSWDEVPGQPKVDIDLQCVVVDDAGSIIDCAYYNNLKAVGSIMHSGDETTGAASGVDEQVWVNMSKVPQNVAVLIFVIAAYKGGSLVDVANGKMHVLEESVTHEVARFDMERSSGQVDVVAAMFRAPGGWTLRIIDEPAREGEHFMDILDLLAEVIRVFVPSAPRRQKVAFAMEKGAIMDLPRTLESITIGLGWDADGGGSQPVDLDVSAICLSPDGLEVETVFFQNLKAKFAGDIVHSGDNLTGDGDGDDEQITANLHHIVEHVRQIVFITNVYTKGRTFEEVRNPYCRIVDNSSGAELCRYSLRDAGNQNGLIVAKIQREVGDRWGFHALGLPCTGRTYKDSLSRVQTLCNEDTKLLRQRGGTMDLSSYSGSEHHHGAPTAGLAAASEPSAPPAPYGAMPGPPAVVTGPAYGYGAPPPVYGGAPPGCGAPPPGYAVAGPPPEQAPAPRSSASCALM